MTQVTLSVYCSIQLSVQVVNKEDKFYCSAGLDDVRWAAVGGGYPSSSSGSGGMTPQVNGVSGTLVTQHHLSSSPSKYQSDFFGVKSSIAFLMRLTWTWKPRHHLS